jgi:hypothetical protein
VQPEAPKEPVQEPEVQAEAEAPSGAGGPTEPEPQPQEVPSLAQEQANSSGTSRAAGA